MLRPKAIVFVSVCVLLQAASVAADTLVNFKSAASSSEGSRGPAVAIRGYLTKPNGEGPLPAVVLMHSCLGLPAARKAIGELYARWGYVALFVDEFSTRGVRETCARDFDQGVSDAYGALLFLAKLPEVDAKRI